MEIRKAFHWYFVQLFERSSGLNLGKPLGDFLTSGLQLTVCEPECCEWSIMAVEVEEVLAECLRDKLPGLDGLPYEFYCIMPDLLGRLMACVYTNWQQNGRIPNSVSQGVVKDLSKGDHMSNYRSITLLNVELEILTKVLAKRLAHVMEKLAEETQTCAISGRSIQDNLHLLHCTLDKVGKLSSKGRTLGHLG